MAHSPVCPPLPAGCVDFDALQAAAKKGADLDALLNPVLKADVPATEIPAAPDAPGQ